jgi:hypothetical protein
MLSSAMVGMELVFLADGGVEGNLIGTSFTTLRKE